MIAPFDIRAEARVFSSTAGDHLYLADGSRIFDLESAMAQELDAAIVRGDIPQALADLIGVKSRYIGPYPIAPPPVKSLSLNVAQACNLSCSYCYADEGRFGGRARTMPEDTAISAIDRLIAEAPPSSDLLIGFMGGEPFVARRLVHAATRYAARAAESAGQRVRFSLTTNATLITDADAELLAEYPFAVAVSLDGTRTSNDRQRRKVNGRGSAYDAALAGLQRLTARRPMHVSVRATVTPYTGVLPEILDHLLSLGVDEAGFAPVIAAPAGTPAFDRTELQGFLAEMIACAQKAKTRALAGSVMAFSNFQTAMQQIHRGAHMPYPCGAGAGYLSVSADGEFFGCHRLVDDPSFRFGDLKHGVDQAKQRAHLAARHVDRQDPCRSCWARYLCGGGCYHEVVSRGRVGCDYIRGWLEFCLSAYAELRHSRPDYFEQLISKPKAHSHV